MTLPSRAIDVIYFTPEPVDSVLLYAMALPLGWTARRFTTEGSRMVKFRILDAVPRRRDIQAVAAKLLLIMKRQGL